MTDREPVLIDMGNGTVFVQRPEPDTSTGTPLALHERAIWKLHNDLKQLRASLSRLEQEWRKEAGQLEQTAVGELGLSVFRALVHKAEHLRQAADALKSIETR